MQPDLPGVFFFFFFLKPELFMGMERIYLQFEEQLLGPLDFRKNEVEKTCTARNSKYATSPPVLHLNLSSEAYLAI